MDILEDGETISPKFYAAVERNSIKVVPCGSFKLVFAVRKGFSDWKMPSKSTGQKMKANQFWGNAS